MSYSEQEYVEFAKRMEEKFPEMFAGQYGGFECGKGWWPIIESLCNHIHYHVKWKNEQKEKYGNGNGCPPVTVSQIKEKFGGLRFYYNGGDDKVDGMVSMAEAWAGQSCETCGNLGTSRKGGWIRTLCDHHEVEHQEYIKARDEGR